MEKCWIKKLHKKQFGNSYFLILNKYSLIPFVIIDCNSRPPCVPCEIQYCCQERCKTNKNKSLGVTVELFGKPMFKPNYKD